MSENKWKSRNGLSNNVVLYGDGFAISYATGEGLAQAGCAPDDGSEETALIKGGKYLILNGDFRKEYEELVDHGYEACKEFFEKHNNRSSWSNTP